MPLNARALLVTAGRHGSALREALESNAIEVEHTSTCREARAALEKLPEFDLVVSDVSLPDGNWWTIFRDLSRLGRQTELIVCVEADDWAAHCTLTSVRGLAEVLVPPFDRAAVSRMLEKLGRAGYGAISIAAGL